YTCEWCGNDLLNGFCSLCNSRNSYVYDPNPNSFDCPPDSYHPPHPTYETYSCDSYRNDSHFGYDCQPQFPLNYESERGYIANYNSYPYGSSSFPQQYLCCENCGGPHETFQCQSMNQNFYNSNSLGFDQSPPSQFPVIHQPPQEISIQEIEDLKQQYLDEMKRLINSEYHDEIKIDELKGNFNNSLIMKNEHLDTISETESDEFIKSSVENLVQIPNLDSNPKNDRFDTKSYLLESLLSRDTLMASSPKFDSLLEEFSGELAHTDLIPPRINEANCDPEEDIHLVERLLYYSDSEGDNLSLDRLLYDDPIPLSYILDFFNVVRVFLPFFTYPVISSILLSSESEDTIFDPGISSYHFSSLEPGASHRSGTFMKFIIYPNHLNESPMKILSSTCSLMDQ
nr:hypothetical protein [Tanacetum cinerariifolium]